ncbi:MAG: tetratricopeptide repeat protein [Planctomycetota bacterium]|jgi:non-specific serine/threonine protein kinase/serine/threonine-protein kinase
MGTDRAHQAREIFLEVVELPVEQRGDRLEERCGDDAALRAEVEWLLTHDRAAGQFMDTPVAPELGPTARLPEPEEGGPREKRIGHYEIKRVIASGGMGTVYEAAQDHPHRLVALKVLSRGAASPQAMKRFRHEVEILGWLRHPNIAQIYDAGTFDEGEGAQPYFAMELVKGRPLIEYCESRKLETRGRLDLFVKVCDAVQYAHLKGVIHRDLKPDNVLVDDFGEPKVLDFGVARATGSDLQVTTLRTDIGQLIGTVPYMSPEQVTGDPTELDTRSDVYSLGVVLYELMCGRLPHDLRQKSIPEAARVIREEDPTPLSSINRVFRGDVETIVAKALEKEKDRRYQSPAELAADVRHYVADEPIVARPPSTFYQLRKFARRNKTLVGGVLGMLVLLVAGIVGTTGGMLEARSEAAKSAAINEYLMKVFALANPAEESDALAQFGGGRITTLQELIDEASKELETAFPEWPEVRADMHLRLGRTYWGHERHEQQGSHLRQAYELYAQTRGADDPHTLVSLFWYAKWLGEERRSVEAEPRFEQAVHGLRRACGPEDRRTLDAAVWMATNLVWLGKYAESELLFRETIETARGALGDGHKVTLSAMNQYGETLYRMERFPEAERVAAEALETARRRLPEGDLLTAKLASGLGLVLKAQNRHAEALEFFEEAYALQHHNRPGVIASSMQAMNDLAFTLTVLDRPDEAENIIRRKIEDCRRDLGDDHEHTLWAKWTLVEHLRYYKRLEEAESLARETQEHFERVLGPDNYWVLFVTRSLALVLADRGELDEAERYFRQALEGRRRTNPDDADAHSERENLAEFLRHRGKLDEAEALYREQLEIQRRVHGPDGPVTLITMNTLAWLLKDRGPEKLAEAESLVREATSRARSALDEDDQLAFQLPDTLAVILHLRGENEQAVSVFEEVVAAARESVGGERWHIVASIRYYVEALAELTGRTDLKVEDYEDLQSVLEALIELYDAWGRPAKAAEYRALLPEAEDDKASD